MDCAINAAEPLPVVSRLAEFVAETSPLTANVSLELPAAMAPRRMEFPLFLAAAPPPPAMLCTISAAEFSPEVLILELVLRLTLPAEELLPADSSPPRAKF
jgi:hypothetical protein